MVGLIQSPGDWTLGFESGRRCFLLASTLLLAFLFGPAELALAGALSDSVV